MIATLVCVAIQKMRITNKPLPNSWLIVLQD